MFSFFITLTHKTQLSHDVYELIYALDSAQHILPGQFLLCDTDIENPKLRRAYSVSDYRGDSVHFIIKKIPNGKGGSKAICEQEIGHTMQVWWPSGNFILPKNIPERVVFIGTGTGFAPLYFQAKHLLESTSNTSISFLFGVREEKDLFYGEKLSEWINKYPQFSYQYCLSRSTQDTSLFYPGRVTDYLRSNPYLIATNTLYSICWSPQMVKEIREILKSHGVEKEYILFEQY